MANLFWKTGKSTRALLDKPFSSEDEFERMVFTTSELLKDIFLLKRQIRGGNKSGIPDILGIDREGNVCIVEMKNTEVDADIIPQVLHYAFWAETNPDSVKSL
jgi:RecB family endonuclease NucS